MLFYQCMLLAGYLYCHWLCSRMGLQRQARVHLWLAALVFAATGIAVVCWGSPLTPASRWKFFLAGSPVLHIIVLLTVAVGLPFFLLSTTAPLMQHWSSCTQKGKSPYRLYALSNLGSLLALLGYPFLVEWLMRIRTQALLWTALFGFFLLLCTLETWSIRRLGAATPRATASEPDRVPAPRIALWCALAACGSMMLLATTNLISQKISANSFLWVVPLSIYLLSFMICFENSRWYKRGVFFSLYFVSVAMFAWSTIYPDAEIDAVRQMSLYCLLLFSVCMVGNGELERLKPASHSATPFYLSIAFGGALGSAFVVLVAPRIFRGLYELHLAVLGTGAVILAVTLAASPASQRIDARFGAGGVLGRTAVAATTLASLATMLVLVRADIDQHSRNMVQLRNFFGIKSVYDKDGIRYLQHGAITHGGQYVAEAMQMEPLFYYNRHSGAGLLLSNYRRISGRSEDQPLRLGLIGLGAGDLAAYSKDGDYLRFYEIDPQVVQLSTGLRPLFTYLRNGRGRIEVITGDARVNMDAELVRGEPQRFDVLVVDAFQGDAPPVHLLTTEAMQLYLQHLRGRNSVIAFNISNRV
ncbi:MAG: ferrichrome ABC transporter permease, partial [Acidobacteria bacterium]|nr:ferrichrome ABC transporter permease [Acidobacteriota bacterium]